MEIIKKNELSLFCTPSHPRYIDFYDVNFNEYKRWLFSQKTLTKRSLEFLRGINDVNKQKSYINSLKNIIDTDYKTNSFEGRLFGLWLWDKIDNPRCDNKMNYQTAAIRLIQQFPVLHTRDDSFKNIILRRYYKNAQDCISAGKILSISNDAGDQPKPAAKS